MSKMKQDLTTLTAPQVIIPEKNGVMVSEGQCDCACPNPPLHNLPAPYPATHLVRNPSLQTIPLDADYRALFIPSSGRPAVLNGSAMLVFDAFTQPLARSDLLADWHGVWEDTLSCTVDGLARLRFLIPPDTPALQPPPDGAKTLVAWLHVTNACNLRCHYCYLRKTNEAMTSGVGRAAINAVFRSAAAHSFSTVKIKYAGGEPTLNFPMVITLHKYAAELAQQYCCTLDEVVLSNGVGLTHSMIDAMLAHNLRLMISLDGVGKIHDSQRIFSNGAGSFLVVSHAVERARTMGLIPDISITVTDRNVNALPETIAWVLDRDLPFRINFYRENGVSTPFKDLQLSEARLIDGMRAAFKVVEANLPKRSLLASLVDRANLSVPHTRTCGVGSNYMVIDHQGHIAKCQMQIERSITSVEAKDPLSLIHANQIGIQNLPVDKKDECRDCQWRYWCGGGCPLATHRVTGRYDVKSPNCDIYKALYPEVLRLEGLRLLKYVGEFTQSRAK